MRIAILFLLLSLSSVAETATPSEGRWVLRASGRPILLLELRKDPAAEGGWAGSLTRPKHFEATSNFAVFSAVEGPVSSEKIIASKEGSDEVEFEVSDDSSKTTALIWRPTNDGGTLKYKDIPIEPIALSRAGPGERVSDAWDKARTYAAMPDWPDNPEMAGIFETDQAARQNPATIDWPVVGKEDTARRLRVKALLDGGQLRSGTDFYQAAFVYQHGSTPDDYLMAHTLAIIAAARGRPDATWIASATLDRYLQSIGQKQIFGTQFRTPNDQPATQEPYDRALVSDALRGALGVPPLAAQEDQRKAFSKP